jgi:hypothetical protein
VNGEHDVVGVGVDVTVGVGVFDGVTLGVILIVGVGVIDIVGVGVSEIVGVGVTDIVEVGVILIVGVGVILIIGVGVIETVDVGVIDIVGVRVTEIVGVGVTEGQFIDKSIKLFEHIPTGLTVITLAASSKVTVTPSNRSAPVAVFGTATPTSGDMVKVGPEFALPVEFNNTITCLAICYFI